MSSNANRREAIAKLLDQRRERGKVAQGTSAAMSQGHNLNIRNRDQATTLRNYRRVITLIRVNLLNQNAAAASNAVSALSDSSLPNALGADLGTAFAQVSQSITNAYHGLLATPGTWLKQNKIQLVRKVGTNGSTPFKFYWSEALNRYVFAPPQDVQDEICIDLSVNHVDVQPYSAISATLGAVNGVAIDAANPIMITTQLTGCSVMYHRNAAGNQMIATHIQPTGDKGTAGRGYSLAATLRGGALNHALVGGTSGVFGCAQGGKPHDYDPQTLPARHTFCIGVFRGGAWELHCQRHNVAKPDDPGESWQII